MLTVLVHQLTEHIIRMPTSDDNVELTEFEEEKESEDKLIPIQYIEVENGEITLYKSFINTPNELVQLDVHKKIPVPPPELV